jgi:hypothetical protein
MTPTTPSTTAGHRLLSVQWGPIAAGAIAAAALASVLHAFAMAIGLAVSSAAPTWRDASIALMLLSGVYLLFVAIVSYGFGGYLAGRLAARHAPQVTEEAEKQDAVHGLLVWALATLLTGLFALAVVQTSTRMAAPGGGQAGPTASVGSENIIAFDIDRLFRSERPLQGDITAARAEAGRILLSASSHRGVLPEDRAYLVRLVTSRTGIAQPEAEQRVNDVIARAKDNLSRARRSGVLLAFMAGAAALIGAVAALYAAWAGGRHRDGARLDRTTWSLWGPTSRTA